MRLPFWLTVSVAACAPPIPPRAPAPPAPVVAPPAPPAPPAPEVTPDPPAAPPPAVQWTPTFAGSSDPPFQSAAPLRLGNDASKPAGGEKYVIRFERTACFGSCPTYAVELSADGKVVYTDHDENGAPRRATGTIPAANVAKLAQHLLAAGFFRLTWDEPCKQRYTDNPGAIVTLLDHGRKRTITDDHGNMCIPHLLRSLEDEIDQLAATAAWPT